MISSFKINQLSLGILIVFSCAYFAKFTSISPVYVVCVPIVLVVMTASINLTKKALSYDSFILVFLTAFVVGTNSENLLSPHLVNLLLGIFCYLVIGVLSRGEISVKLIISSFNIILFLFTIETSVRLLYPTAPSEQMWNIINSSDTLWFYKYKFGSFMFADSNTSGLFLLLILFFLSSNMSYLNTSKFKIRLCIVLVVLTFSRSCIAAMMIGSAHIALSKRLSGLTLLIFYGIIVCVLISTFFIIDIFDDGSLSSKLYIFDIFGNILLSDGINGLLLGRGVDYMFQMFSINSHVLALSVILDLGLISFFLYAAFIIYYSMTVSSYVLFPFLISSLSYCLYYGFPLLFVVLALDKYIRSQR